MSFKSINLAFNHCKSCFSSELTHNEEIKMYLTKYLTIYICAIFEKKVKDLFFNAISSKMQRSDFDLVINDLVHILVRKKLQYSEIKGILGKINKALKNDLDSRVTEREINQFNNIITNRHNVAHITGSNFMFTFSDLEAAYTDALKIIDGLEQTLQTI